ncbi:MAG: hypothetical protein GF350_05525 [Chitinivibrionales bacterium]|nr:hypothetical protein [Chitinivibrionales bacterium]
MTGFRCCVHMFFFLSFLCVSSVFAAKDITINVHLTEEIGEINPFWRGSGHNNAMYETVGYFPLNTAYIGGIPHGNMEYMRLHHCMYLIPTSKGERNFDFSELDKVFDQFNDNGLRPNLQFQDLWSSCDFLNSEQDRQWWYDLIKALAEHYIERYGIEEVRKWLFSLEGEPGPKTDESAWDLATKGLVEAAALRDVDEQLFYEGPGRAGSDDDYFVNYFMSVFHDSLNPMTGEKHTRLDGVKWSGKGPWWWAAKDAKNKVDYINEHCPQFKDEILLIDDESDPESGHGMPLGWRTTPAYQAMLANRVWMGFTLVQEQYGGKYLLMNQDNAFLHGFVGRSLMCKFEHPTNNDRFELIKSKMSSYEMYSLFGEKHILTDGYTSAPIPTVGYEWDSPQKGRVEAVATRDPDGRVAVMIFNNREFYIRSEPDDATITLNFEDLPFSEVMLVHYRIDYAHSNPMRVWQEMSGPVTELTGEVYGMVWDRTSYLDWFPEGPANPTKEQFAQIRDRMELETMEDPRKVSVSGGSFSMQIDLPCPSVSMIILAPEQDGPPPAVSNVRAQQLTNGITDERHTLVRWDESPSKYIQTYEVLWSPTENGAYTRVNNADFFTTTFMHCHPQSDPEGFYQVKPVDYWDNAGSAVESRRDNLPMDTPKSRFFRKNALLYGRTKQPARLVIMNSLGRKIAGADYAAGEQVSADFNSLGLESGVYYAVITTGETKNMLRIVLP